MKFPVIAYESILSASFLLVINFQFFSFHLLTISHGHKDDQNNDLKYLNCLPVQFTRHCVGRATFYFTSKLEWFRFGLAYLPC